MILKLWVNFQYRYFDLVYKEERSVESNLELDSVMIQEEDLNIGDKRLLTVDNVLILPVKSTIRFIVLLKMFYIHDLFQN